MVPGPSVSSVVDNPTDPTSTTLEFMGNGELAAALNIVSRFDVPAELKAQVMLVNDKYAEAATAYIAAEKFESAAACALLVPLQTQQLLLKLKGKSELSDLVDTALSLKIISIKDAHRIVQALSSNIPVGTLISEYNVTVVCRVAESVHFATLSQVIEPGLDLEKLVCQMIASGKLDATVDQNKQIVSVRSSGTSRQAATLQLLFDGVENIAGEISQFSAANE